MIGDQALNFARAMMHFSKVVIMHAKRW